MKKIEIVGKRNLREKHFLLDDGDMVAEMYEENVHFLKDGNYEEIDNTLTLKNEYYINKNNDFIVSFPTKLQPDILTIEKDNHYIIFELNKYDNYKVEHINTDSKLKSKVIYTNVLKNINIRYDISSSKLKETIILLEKDNNIDDLCFNIKTDLDLKINDNGEIVSLYDNKEIFKFDLPYMIDLDDKFNNNVSYNLIKEDDMYQLFMSLDKKWLDCEAEYPVMIDPTITNQSNESSVIDTYIYPNDTAVTRGNLDHLKVGVEKVNNIDVVNRTLLKFDLPNIGTGSQVVNAELLLYNYHYYTNKIINEIINIHRVTQDWTENAANWNNMNNAYDSRVDGTFRFFGYYHLDENNLPIIGGERAEITSLVQKWYTDTPNYGIMLKLCNENYKDTIIPKFYSRNNNIVNANPKPILMIKYRNQNGLEDYMNYETYKFTKGTSYHNTYNGNLILVLNLLTTKNSKLPADLKLIYNTNDVVLNKNMGYGIGFKLNYNQTIKEVIIDNKTYLEYEDGDGTLHYFLNERQEIQNNNVVINSTNNIFFDEDGLDLEIEKFDTKFILKNKNNNTMTFSIYNNIGYLTEIKDVSGNTNIINYTYNYDKIVSIEDSDQQIISFNYSSSIYAPNIYINNGVEHITLSRLDVDCLSSIIFSDGAMYINTNSEHLIWGITDTNNKRIQYEYYENVPYKIKKVLEYGTNYTIGDYYNVKYGFNTTTIIDSRNRRKTITFNNYGNPVSIFSSDSSNNLKDAYGINIKYGGEFNGVNINKNKILSSQIPIRYVKNLLDNSSFEDETTDFSSGQLGICSLTENFSNSGFKSLKFESLYTSTEAFVSKYVNVPKDKFYTFSAYIKAGSLNRPAKLFIEYEDSEGRPRTFYSNELVNNEEFERLDLTVFYPQDAVGDLKIGVCLLGNGQCYIDDVQLEESEVVNNYNLINNSDFSNGLNDWTLCSYGSYNTNDIFSVVNIDNQTALKINMYTDNNSSIEKTFNIKGKLGDQFTLSFWYKNKGLNSKELFEEGSQNIVDMIFYPTDEVYAGDMIENYTLNPNEEEWQFFICTFSPWYDFSGFKLKFDQYLNGNELYITNINLFKNIKCITYDYDKNGNLISSLSTTKKTKKFKYDNNNQLINIINSNGSNFIYEYDNIITNRIIRGISESKIVNEIEYNEFGNPILTRIINRGIMYNPNEGLYKIRLKGTNDCIELINNNITLFEDIHNHNKWRLEKVIIEDEDYFKISHSLINDKYLSNSNDYLIVTSYQNDNSLFKIIKRDNGSFILKNKQTNKCIKNDNRNLILSDYIDDDFNFEFYFEENNNELFIENNAIYTEDGKFITKTIDSNFNEVEYDIDNITGRINSLTSKGIKQSYNYNSYNQLTSIICNDRVTNYEYNNNNLLSQIEQNGRVFNLDYNEFLNLTSIRLNNQVIITNIYENNFGNLLSVVYGNNQTINYEYDSFDRIKKIIKNDNIYNYKYNNNGDLAKIVSNNNIEKYTYDNDRRLCEYQNDEFYARYKYNINDMLIFKQYKFNNKIYNINNIFNNDNLLEKLTFDNSEINYNYDDLGRLSGSNIDNQYSTNYKYITRGKRTSTIVESINNNDDIYKYKYDNNNNIICIYHNGNIENKYYYDKDNQLKKEDNYLLNKTIKYKYDIFGNILCKTECKLNTDEKIRYYKYEYNNSNLLDQLTSYDGNQITYDDYGNITSIGNINLTWQNGKELCYYTDSINNIEYKYNVNSIRTHKIVNNLETKYYTDGEKIVLEKRENDMLYYIYNSEELVGFKYNNDIYYYIKNNQNDIIGILNSDYNLVAKYTYDSWGNIMAILNENNEDVSSNYYHIANINPYRYRSYYYDVETKLYYLNKRYYSPKLGRFISFDEIISASNTIKGNLYSYCNNDPINNVDSSGMFSLKGLIKKAKNGIKKIINTVVNSILGVTVNKVSSKVTSSTGNPVAFYSETGTTSKSTILKAGNDKSPYKVAINYDVDNILNSSADLYSGDSYVSIGLLDKSTNKEFYLKKLTGTFTLGWDIQGLYVGFSSDININNSDSVGAYHKAGVGNLTLLALALIAATQGNPEVVAACQRLLDKLGSYFPLEQPLQEILN